MGCEKRPGWLEPLLLSPDQASHSQAVEVGPLERAPESGTALTERRCVFSFGDIHCLQQSVLTEAVDRLREECVSDLLQLSLIDSIERRAVPADEGHADDHPCGLV